jgi:drug/metabolite transporter (DMT)-like permease
VLALLLALSASLCWGLADFVGGVQTRRTPGTIVVLVSQTIGAVGLLLCVLATGDLYPGWDGLRAALVAGLLLAVGLTSFYQALSIGTMSVVAPITATGAVVPVLIGLAGGERPGGFEALGMLAALVGVLLATQDGEADHGQRRLTRRSIMLALVAAACIGGGLAAYDQAAESGVLPAVMWARWIAVGALLVAVVVTRPTFDSATLRLPALVAIGALDAAATALYAGATTKGLLSVVAVTSSLYPAVTVALARTLLGERLTARQATGIAVALAGVALLAAG